MKIYYDSKTGNTKRFCNKLPYDSDSIGEVETITSPFILVTHATGFGNVPLETIDFLQKNAEAVHTYMKGVACSGNVNWGSNYAKPADIISKKYNVPVILKFEMFGTEKDVKDFVEGVEGIETR
ncbi:flavodoxin [Bacillus phage BCD7]|uniref:Putative ribonucleotide reductase stimulatory protein n=1 Tax=Bacillus phage BCD7 TaxID=1136534 RepID=J9PTY0_9CAUD|nr:flavodoxin [Bacillus phage BCD7]AEZ50488.1 putative ribonucleotide reductase stimulatory protein [Bacillus phage BCD7]